jgi:predicted ATPase
VINQLDLTTFKCFDLLRLPLGSLTLLSGTNASGKSSILQALVLPHQTMQENEWSTRLILNGTAADLGTATDVIDKVQGRDGFQIGLIDEETSCHWSFGGDRRDMSLQVNSVTIKDKVTDYPGTLHFLMPVDAGEPARSLACLVRDLTYITAEREGPREVYPLEDQHAVTRVGPRGENAVSVLERGRDQHVVDGLRFPDTPPTLLHQVGARLDAFFPGCAVHVQQVSNANAVTLGIRTSETTGFLRPIHCGFGISQVLPIIVAALSIPRGSLMLIENPEVHLHPAGQALMGQFLADVAQSGIQVIVETHSDHVLNGVRRAVKAERIPAQDVMIHFLRARTANAPQVLSPTLDNSGNIDAWPEGFFDQFDKDMDYFAGWGA